MKPPSTTPQRFRIGALALAAAQVILAVTAGLAVAPVPAQQQNNNAGAPTPGEPITLNFTNAEIESVARTMAVVTGRDVVVDPRVKGTINLVTDRPVPPGSAFNQFAAALRLQGFAIVESEGLYKIVPEADAKLQTNTVTTSVGAAQRVAGNQIVTQVFKLNYESANNLLPVLRPLIAPNNTINVNPGNNTLVVTDYAENMRRLGRIIAALDVPNASDVEVIQLRHSIATDLVPLVQRLVDGSGGSTGAPGQPAVAAAPGGQGDASFRTTLLAEPRSNAIIMRAANPARAQLVRTLIEKLDKAPVDNGNGAAGNIYVVYLKNADAVRLAASLRAAIAADPRSQGTGLTGAAGGTGGASGGLSSSQPVAAQQAGTFGMQGGSSSPQSTAPLNNANQPSTGGQVQADPSTNSLIITASEPQYRQLRAVIDRLDSKRAQVMVEALIAEVNADKAAQFGVQWQGLLGGNNNRYIGNSSNVLANILNIAVPGSGAAGVPPPTGLNLASSVTIAGQTVLGFLANFLESNADGNILATPNLLTLDNEEAKIVVGQNLPFVTGQYTNTGSSTNTVNPFQTIERKDVGLTLRVRPTINEDNTVRLQVFQEVSTVVPTTLNNINGPTTNKRSIESNVVVDNGNLIALGGLLQDEYGNSTDKVPLAGDVPVLGYLFRNDSRTRKKINLMVFLRPVVVRDNFTSDVLTFDRYDAMRSSLSRVQPESNIFLGNVPAASQIPPLAAPQAPAGAVPAPLSLTPPASRSTPVQGTRLIPPEPLAPLNPPPPSTLRGTLPPTADPASQRELP
ncbi:type II secretion system secretin GspD [Variovorax sp. OV329]|uniref:type II secretion system secretin GspD n=1 Tax=Variovorax sp. OV329 TaxID=1882825 RepID=UPI0008E3CB93|nr:type II secretion system secretin GspD [Variovorax sp. OV329]SFM16837.1 general secretion pathway protein D [Variovorax sp. OV329]